MHLHDFGIFLELTPDEEEKQLLENNIQVSLQKEQVNLEDAIDVRNIKNLKLAICSFSVVVSTMAFQPTDRRFESWSIFNFFFPK